MGFRRLLVERLGNLERALPGASFVCLLSKEGELIAFSSTRESPLQHKDSLVIVAALRNAALNFATALSQLDCRAVHVAGEESVFSCYDVSQSMLAFYSDPPPDGFDTAAVDAAVAEVIEDLNALISANQDLLAQLSLKA
eukprot:CAMPEP_0185780226 /NCGR_PEP_ID=MMETSP1174-20130828/98404_1 /TAXON_ID=35687 /ORGANISM="Dictyocha speculum, Strain CCMP1381" /LENGTH=139 /DNA_ID=CAMNT_0028469705 /DNA_START=6 /DNA_END=425 /DNA_ORIENTATION=-